MISTGKVARIEVPKGFFDQVPNIRNVEVCCQLLLRNENTFLGADVKLENFVIRFMKDDRDKAVVCTLLNKLHVRDFYKRLHWYQLYGSIDQQTFNLMASLRGLDTISIYDVEPGIIWPIMNDLKQMYVYEHERRQFDAL